jgi:thiosulfate dehydrogenase [quinone] large subunit
VTRRSNVRQQPRSGNQPAQATTGSGSSRAPFDHPVFSNPVFSNPLWVLLPLRLFLGVTFLYAGLSKIAQSSFLDEDSPASMHATLLAVKGSSPIGGLLGPVVDHTFVFGLFMALAETAVGIGTLLGLFSRIAALGGMVLSFSLFLTVSWGADPWYTGADLVYFIAFTPLILAGALPYSVDEWLARAAVRAPGVGEDRTRRALLAGGAAVGALVAVGLSSLLRSDSGSTKAAAATTDPPTPTSNPTPTTSGAASPSASATSSAKALVAASAVPVGGGKEVTDPTSGDQVWVLQLETGKYTALDAKCPHQGCAVNFVSSSAGFSCPCHQSTFAATGALTRGPATTSLKTIAVTESNGQITRA